MDCWSVTDDIRITYEELLDSPWSMDEDEVTNILIGLEALYARKFDRLFSVFEKVCDHGGIWLDEELVTVAKQHKEYNNKLDNMFEDEHISDPPDEYNSETQEDRNRGWERYEEK